MRKKSNISEYKLDIYPRELWVSTADNVDEICNKFNFLNNDLNSINNDIGRNSILSLIEKEGTAAVTYAVQDKLTGNGGCIIIIFDIEYADVDCIAHESVHYADYVYQSLGMYSQDFVYGNEPYAYLVGWCAGKIDNFLIEYKKTK